MSNLNMPKLSDIPYPQLSNDPKKAMQMLGKVMAIDSYLLEKVDPEEFSPVLAGLFFYRFLKQSERTEVLTLAQKNSSRQLFAVIQRKASDMIVSKDWALWSQSAEELMESKEFSSKISTWLGYFGFGPTVLAGLDIASRVKTATSASTRGTVIGHAAKRFIVFFALGTVILLASSERQKSLNDELERRKLLVTSHLYK